MLITTQKILSAANRGGYAVGAFNTNNLETTKAIIDAAVEMKSPVIIQTSEGAIEYAGLDYLVAIIGIAAKAPVPVAMHLDHGKDLETIRAAIRAGYTSVMIDASTLPFRENVAKTRKVVGWAHRKGVSVEAEIGAISGIEDLVNVSDKEALFTDPEEARRFAELTGCDSLAISIGTAHGAFKSKIVPELDIDRLKKIDRVVKVPLVLHGASGVPAELVRRSRRQCGRLEDCDRLSGAVGIPDPEIRKAIRHGIRKINVDTDLRIAFTVGLRDTMLDDRKTFDPRRLLKRSVAEMNGMVRNKIRLFGSANRTK